MIGRGATVSGTFDDAGGRGVDPKSVRIRLTGAMSPRKARSLPSISPYRADLPAGRHTVDVAASDLTGNAVRRSWSFDVAASVAAIPVTVPLQVTSHANKAQVDSGATVVQGRTAPGAFVDIKVNAIASVVVSTQRVQADGNGNFPFSFTPQLPLPGTRYEATMVSIAATCGRNRHWCCSSGLTY